ncbi:hypothetical protein [Acinetobacter junii]|uniref:hypothetical protein n=1 Tax=Acinetobacter junii TaxID=40215 RepID=UPI00384EDF90
MQSPSNQNIVQTTFVAMIFAFVISFHAQNISEFLTVITNNWTSFPLSPDITIDFLAVATQILLALLMISISWIMWSKSKASAHINDIQQIFTVKFLTFILEIILVILYYSLAKSIEVDFSEYNKTKNMSDYITRVSPQPEIFIMIMIFSIFLLWDIITDIIKSPTTPIPSGTIARLKNLGAGYIVYCSTSTVCLIAAIAIFFIIPSNSNALITIISDLALITILLFFYQAKILEYYGLKLFPSQESRNNTKRNTPPTNWELFGIIILFSLYIIFAIMVGICIHQ